MREDFSTECAKELQDRGVDRLVRLAVTEGISMCPIGHQKNVRYCRHLLMCSHILIHHTKDIISTLSLEPYTCPRLLEQLSLCQSCRTKLMYLGIQVKLQAYLGKGESAPYGIVVEVSAKQCFIGKGAKLACLMPTSIQTGFGSRHTFESSLSFQASTGLLSTLLEKVKAPNTGPIT